LSKTAILILLITIGGAFAAFYEPFFGLLAYLFLDFTRPGIITYGALSGLRLAFFVAFITVITLVLKNHKIKIANTKIYLILLFWIFCLVSFLLSSYRSSGMVIRAGTIVTNEMIMRFNDFTKTILILIIFYNIINSAKKFRYICLFIAIVVGGIAARYGFFGALRGGVSQLGGTLGDNNYYGAMTVMALPFVAYCAKIEQNKYLKYMFYLMVPFVIMAIFWTNARGAFVALLGVLFWLFLRSRHKAISLISLVLAAFLFLNFAPAKYLERLQTIQQYKTEASGRLHCQKVAIEMVKNKPFFGVGFSAYESAYDDYDFLKGKYGPRRSVHNSVFQILSENGILGFSIWVFLLISVYYTTFIKSKRFEKSLKEDKAIYINYFYMLETALVGALLSGLTINIGYLSFPWLLIGLVIALEDILKKEMLKEKQA